MLSETVLGGSIEVIIAVKSQPDCLLFATGRFCFKKVSWALGYSKRVDKKINQFTRLPKQLFIKTTSYQCIGERGKNDVSGVNQSVRIRENPNKN